MMRCISLIQPWASLVVLGMKRIETRTFKIPKDKETGLQYKGRLYIHASANIPGRVYEQYLRDETFRRYVNSAARLSNMIYNEGENLPYLLSNNGNLTAQTIKLAFPTGAIIGRVTLGDCDEGFEVKRKLEGRGMHEDFAREWALGDLSSDHFGWYLTDPEAIDPIHAKGTISPILWDCEHYINDSLTENI